MTLPEILGANISRLRRSQGISVKQLAIVSEVTPTLILQIEWGNIWPDKHMIEKIAHALAVPSGMLVQLELLRKGLTATPYVVDASCRHDDANFFPKKITIDGYH